MYYLWTITNYKERIQTGDSRYIYQNELDKAYFEDDMAYGDFKNPTIGKGSDKILRDKAFNIAKNAKYDGYQKDLASMVHKCFDKKTIKNEIMSNKALVK